MSDDPVMRRAFEGQRLLLQGDRAGARESVTVETKLSMPISMPRP